MKALSRVGRRADGRSDGRLPGPAATLPEPTTDRVDEQLSVLLQSIEIDSSEQGVPRRAPRPPYSRSASARPLGRAQTAALPRVVAKTQRVDPIVRERIVLIFAAVMIGILGAIVAIWLQDQTLGLR